MCVREGQVPSAASAASSAKASHQLTSEASRLASPGKDWAGGVRLARRTERSFQHSFYLVQPDTRTRQLTSDVCKTEILGMQDRAGVGWTQHRLVWSSPFPWCVSSFSVASTAAWSNRPTLDSCSLDHFVFCFFDSALKMSRICPLLSGSMASASIQSPLSLASETLS